VSDKPTYKCPRCGENHYFDSKIGRGHLKYVNKKKAPEEHGALMGRLLTEEGIQPHPAGATPEDAAPADPEVIKQLQEEHGVEVPKQSWGVNVATPEERAERGIVARYRDANWRWQGKYTKEHEEQGREAGRLARQKAIGDNLPQIRDVVSQDIQGSRLTQDRVLAGITYLIDKHFLRVGSETYAEESDTFGASSLRKKHVTKIDGDEVHIDFTGKKQHPWSVVVKDADFAKLARSMMTQGSVKADTPLFQFRRSFKQQGRKSEVRSVTDNHVRTYLKKIADDKTVTPHAFRSYHATRLFTDKAMERGLPYPPGTTPTDAHLDQINRNIKEIIAELAPIFGHDKPETTEKSYISSAAIDAYRAGHPMFHGEEQAAKSYGAWRTDSEERFQQFLESIGEDFGWDEDVHEQIDPHDGSDYLEPPPASDGEVAEAPDGEAPGAEAVEEAVTRSLPSPVLDRLVGGADIENGCVHGVAISKGLCYTFAVKSGTCEAVSRLVPDQARGHLLFAAMADQLSKGKRGARKPGHKYIHRYWKNGRWRYQYSDKAARNHGNEDLPEAALGQTRHSLPIHEPHTEDHTAEEAFHHAAERTKTWVTINHPQTGEPWIEVMHRPHVAAKNFWWRPFVAGRSSKDKSGTRRVRGTTIEKMIAVESTEGSTHDKPYRVIQDVGGANWLSVRKLPPGGKFGFHVLDLRSGKNWERGTNSQGYFVDEASLDERVKAERTSQRRARKKGKFYPFKGQGSPVVNTERKPVTAVLESGDLPYTSGKIKLWGKEREGALIPVIDNTFITGLMKENAAIIRSAINSALRRFDMGLSQVGKDRLDDVMQSVGASIVTGLRRYDPTKGGYEAYLKTKLREDLASQATKSPLMGEIRRVADDHFRGKGEVTVVGETGEHSDVFERTAAGASPGTSVRRTGADAEQALREWRTHQQEEFLSWVQRNPHQAQTDVGGTMFYEKVSNELEGVQSLSSARKFADQYTGRFGIQPNARVFVQADVGLGKQEHHLRADQIIDRRQQAAAASQVVDQFVKKDKIKRRALKRFFHAHASGENLSGLVEEMVHDLLPQYRRRKGMKETSPEEFGDVLRQWISTTGKEIAQSKEYRFAKGLLYNESVRKLNPAVFNAALAIAQDRHEGERAQKALPTLREEA